MKQLFTAAVLAAGLISGAAHADEALKAGDLGAYQAKMRAAEAKITEAAKLLDGFGYYNVARAILHPPKVDITPAEAWEAEGGQHP